jgi:hypothetical protein
MMSAVVATIWVAIIASVIRPVVGIIVPSSVITSIRVTIVATISVATISVATVPVATVSVARISPIAIATPLRHITVYAALRICGWSKRRRYRKREDAH